MFFPTTSTPGGTRATHYVASGALTIAKCAQLAGLIEHLAVQGWTDWVLDFASVPHADFRGLELLLRASQRLEMSGGSAHWCGMSPYLADIARVAGAHDRPVRRGRREATRGLVGT
ncbi:MAG: STAS domain-containing protein [Candidatus Eisenbacteria bacterium]|nr:STAS domain-containing protein [Candidatus Eisenbacteria bacterium]